MKAYLMHTDIHEEETSKEIRKTRPHAAMMGVHPIHTLENDETTIGRGNQNKISIDNRTISRKHALLKKKGDAFYIVDQGSKHGTYVNGEKVPPMKPYQISEGDEIKIGSRYFRPLEEGFTWGVDTLGAKPR